MPNIQFYALDIRKAEVNERQAVQIFGRTKQGEKICMIDDSLQPYFYVIPKKGVDVASKIAKIEVERNDKISRVTNAESMKKNILGKEVETIKVSVPLEKDIRVIRGVISEWEIIEGMYEYDIPFARRYILDKKIIMTRLIKAEAEEINLGYKIPTYLARTINVEEESFDNPKILAFDIETDNPDGREIDMKKNPVIMISFYGQDFKKVITWKRFKTNKRYIEFVNSEVELIERFLEILEKYAPDIITGYNSDNFDFPYIIERARKYSLDMRIAADKSRLRILGKDNARPRINGIVNIDLYRFVKRSMNIEGGNSLDNVGERLLGMGKMKVDIEKLHEAWENNEEVEKFCEYNLMDSEITYKICMKVLPNILDMSRITGMQIDNVTRLGYSQLVEFYLLRQASDFNEIAPNKPNNDEIAKRFLDSYKGGFVFEPIPGLYDDIVVFDFRSLYPTIMVSHNISPETINCECCKEEGISPDDEEKHNFCTNKKGFIPLILQNLILRRARVKEMMKDDTFKKAHSENLKILANSFYGYLGFSNARWYCIECAKAITSWGRHYIKKVIKNALDKGFNVVYSDTDSIFMAIKEDKEKAIDFLDDVNKNLPGVMELEFEGFYKRGLFVPAKEKTVGAKKKYALLNEDGSVKIRGFETVRKNWSEIGRKTQREVIDRVLKTGKSESGLEYARNIINSIKEKAVLNKETVIMTTLQKEIDQYDSMAPHVSVAKRMKEKGVEVKPGTMISYIIIEGEGKINERARLADEVEEGGYDSDYYINNQVVPSVEKIFEVFGIEKEAIISDKEQKKLGDY